MKLQDQVDLPSVSAMQTMITSLRRRHVISVSTGRQASGLMLLAQPSRWTVLGLAQSVLQGGAALALPAVKVFATTPESPMNEAG